MSNRHYHVLMPYTVSTLEGRSMGSGILSEVWECGPGYTRQDLFNDVIAKLRDLHQNRVVVPMSFNVGLNDL